MWRKLQEYPPYLLKTTRENGFVVYVTNYITIWFVNHSYESFATCLQNININLEADTKKLTQKGLDLLLNPTGLSNVIITKGPSSLEVSITKLSKYPLKIVLELFEGSREMFSLNVTQMLIRTDLNLKASQQELKDLLKKKNEEVEEYKCVSKKIALSCLKTENSNNTENQEFKENGNKSDICNITHEGTSTMINENGIIKQEISEEILIKVELQLKATAESEAPAESEPLCMASSSNRRFEIYFSSNTETSSDSESDLCSESDYAQARDRCRRSLNRTSIQHNQRENSRSPLRTAIYSDNQQDNVASRSRQEFIWTPEATQAPQNKKHMDFSDKMSGISQECNLDVNSSELAFFEHFLDEHLVQQVVDFTNKYHRFFVEQTPPSKHSRLSLWKEVTVSEMYVFIAVTMLMTRNKHLSIEEHWSTDALLSCPIFSNVMPRNRYCMILGMLSFCEPGSCDTNDPRLHKLRLLINYTRNKFKKSFIPYCDLCVHDSTVTFKGRETYKQNLMRRIRFGIKLFLLCDVKTNYILDFMVYCGSDASASEIDCTGELGVTGTIVTTLLKDYFGTNRKLYTDDWYTTPRLYKSLLENGIYACGMVNVRRDGMPNFNALQNGQVEAKYSQGLLALKWSTQRDNYMLSSWHDSSMKPTRKMSHKTGAFEMKPACLVDYSRNTKVVDNSDMMMSSLQCMRKAVKWYKKLALHIFDMQLLNAFYVYKTVTKRKCQLSRFQLAVIRQTIHKYKGEIKIINTNKGASQCSDSRQENPLRILPGNFAEHMPKYIADKKSLRCKVCAIQKRRKDTRFFCNVCQVSLCVVPCFQIYHQKT